MCGIAGIVSIDSTPLTAEHAGMVARMLDILRHRGPDEKGVRTFAGAVIGNARLHIVGGESGKQPADVGKFGLAFNGEIYNYKELARRHHVPGTPDSDTAVLLACLARRGMDVLNELNGMFGFCFVAGEHVYLVRDRFGEKPLFYTVRGGMVHFASEIKALLAGQAARIVIPPLYAELEHPAGQLTLFAGIRQLEPGTYLAVNRRSGRCTIRRYYQFPAAAHTGRWEDQVRELRALVGDAVALRVPPDQPHGVYLSGGLDSSLIALTSHPDAALTYVPANQDVPSEDHFADEVASQLPHAQYLKAGPDPRHLLHDVIATIYANDGPATTLAAYSQLVLARRASTHGLRVVLGGMGADEFFGGYARHAITLLPPESLHPQLRGQYQQLVSRRAGVTAGQDFARIINRAPAHSTHLTQVVEQVFAQHRDPMRAMSISEVMFSLPPLLAADDRLNMAAGIETRHPLLDHRVVEFALGLPVHSKVSGTGEALSLKHILREAFSDVLPVSVYARKDKVGFTSHLNTVLRTSWSPLIGHASAILRSAYPGEPYYRPGAVDDGQFGRRRYQLLQLAITHLLFCEKQSPGQIAADFSAVLTPAPPPRERHIPHPRPALKCTETRRDATTTTQVKEA